VPFKDATEYRAMQIHRNATIQQADLTPSHITSPLKLHHQNYLNIQTIDIPPEKQYTSNKPPEISKKMVSKAIQEGETNMMDKSNETDDLVSCTEHYTQQLPLTQIKTKEKIGMFLPSQYEDEKEVYKRKISNFKRSIEQTAKIQELAKKVNALERKCG
jgi:hypothetical protein